MNVELNLEELDAIYEALHARTCSSQRFLRHIDNCEAMTKLRKRIARKQTKKRLKKERKLERRFKALSNEAFDNEK